MRYKVLEPNELQEGDKRIVKVKEMEIGVYLIQGEYYAWRNVCPHAAAPVCAGVVTGTRMPSRVGEYAFGMDNQILRCPWHGWEFDLVSGCHLAGGKTKLRGFPVESDESGVYVVLQNRS